MHVSDDELFSYALGYFAVVKVCCDYAIVLSLEQAPQPAETMYCNDVIYRARYLVATKATVSELLIPDDGRCAAQVLLVKPDETVECRWDGVTKFPAMWQHGPNN